jgi:glycerol-3-phosphate dehydrogenase
VTYDLLVIGGGINGAGIARDAAGRGLSVLLAEKSDLASATSSASSKLIHGGLRYLEQFEFRLVAEALAEREVMLRIAAHLAAPLRFVMPHVPQLRPRWMIALGLFLYDHLARRSMLPGSRRIRLDLAPYAGQLAPRFTHGFIYSDCRVDDARLVIANALDAKRLGARILVRTECLSAHRRAGVWRAVLSSGEEVDARAMVNAAGPWVSQVLEERLGEPSREAVRLVKGSHIVVPRLYEGEHAFILQNEDRRVVFMIPYEERFTLIGTTDEPAPEPRAAEPSMAEVRYLCDAVNRYLARPLAPDGVHWRYAGVRPLCDDGASDLASITRDYTLRLSDAAGAAPLLTVFGGKITIYRRLAEQVLDRLRPYLPHMKAPWTASAPLPGSDFAGREDARAELAGRYPRVASVLLDAIFRRHGSRAAEVIGDGILGEDYGGGLTERELRYFVEHEWAAAADDVLWRRSKAGLHMNERQRERVAEVLGR